MVLKGYKLFFLSLIGLFFINEVVAQEVIDVAGNVKDERTGLPLAGVTVSSSVSDTQTDEEGGFSLSAKTKEKLTFTYIGYQTIELEALQTHMEVKLIPSASDLDEVVVVGYGEMKRSDLTGSVKSVSMEDVASNSDMNVMQQLKGKTAGLNVEGGAKADDSPSISIRGQNTLSASNSPLIVLDGVIFRGNLTDINSNDIERIDILKDASSAAIYGSRSANGVLLVTTKKGKEGKPKISYDFSYGVQSVTHNPVKWMNAAEYANRLVDYSYLQSLYNWYKSGPSGPEDKGGKPEHPGYSEDVVRNYLKSEDERKNYTQGNSVNWIDEVSKNGPILNNNLSISGASQSFNYFGSASYTNREGVLKGDEFERLSLNTRIEGDLTSWLKLGLNVMYSDKDYSGIAASMQHAQNSSPLASMYDENGRYPDRFNAEFLMAHPLRYEYIDDFDKRKNRMYLGYAHIEVPFLDGLEYDFNYSNNYSSAGRKTFYPSSTYEGSEDQGVATVTNSEETSWIFNHIVRYGNEFNDIHKIDLTFVYTRDQVTGNSSKIDAKQFTNETLGYNNLSFAQLYTIGSGAYKESSLGYMARANYSLLDKYLFTGTFRRDGFSGFGEKNKLANFYSAALAWNIYEEEFMGFSKNWLDYLKIRLSYGQNGNQGIGRYSSLSRMSTLNYIYENSPAIGLGPNTLGNSDLGWETTNSANFAIDFSVLNDRISGSLDYYISKTKNVLVERNLPGATGYPDVWTNIGAIRNRGFEAEINTVNINREIKWESDFVFFINRDKITDLYGDGKDDIGNQWFLGEPISAIYDYKRTGGVWTEDELYNGEILEGFYPGQFRLEDRNGDNKITANQDRRIVGYATPNYRFGIGNTISYKNISFYFFINSIQGGNGYYIGNLQRLLEATPDFDYAQRANQPAIYENWLPDNGVTEAPPIYNYPVVASGNYQDRSFIRLQDVSLQYNLHTEKLSRVKIQELQLFASGKNLYTWTKWKGYDPELGGYYDMMNKSISVGCKLIF